MLVNLKVRTCIILVLLLFTGAMFVSNGVAWMGLNSSNTKLDQINAAYTDQEFPSTAPTPYSCARACCFPHR